MWRLDKLSEEDQKTYQKHLEDLRYGASMAWIMKVDAEDRIKKNEKIEIAKGMLKKGLDIDLIEELTGLPQNEIKKL